MATKAYTALEAIIIECEDHMKECRGDTLARCGFEKIRNIALQAIADGHTCYVYNRDGERVQVCVPQD